MKPKYLFIPLFVGAIALTACKDKTEQATSGETSQQPVTSDASAAEPIKPTFTLKERAAKLGFARHLPKDMVVYDGIFNGRKAFDKILKSSLGEFILERLEDEEISLEELMENGEFTSQIAMYSEEYFTAYGGGTDAAFDQAVQLLERLGFYGARFGAYFADGFVRDGEDFKPKGGREIFEGPLKGASKEAVKMFTSFSVPAFYQGAKISDKETRETVMTQMEQAISMLGLMGKATEEITITRGDFEFSGYKVNGEQLAEQLKDETIMEIHEELGISVGDIQAFKKALASKTLVAVAGEVGEYVILFFGKSEDDLKIVDDVADSICASEKIVFLDSYLDKDLLTVGFYDEEVVKSVGNVEAIGYRFLSSVATGFSEGLSEAGSLGDTQDVEALLDSLGEQGEKLASMFSGTNSGYVAFLEDGLKVEAFGGSNQPALDFGKSHTLAPMAGGKGNLLFANWTSNEAYNEKVFEYLDTLGETAYLMTKRVAALDIEDRDFQKFQQSLDVFDKSFKNDALGIWKALRGDLADGLGAEAALVVDINGSLPKVPNVPAVVLEEGKIPRISYVSKVADRAKLQASWKGLNSSIENILKTVSDILGGEVPMQVPMSSEKNDLKTWFVPIPFQNDDFVPSVSVSDELFLASTSKTFSESLAERFKKGGGESRKGAWLRVDFKVFHQYARQWLDLVEDNADELIPSDSVRADFDANKPMIKKAMEAFSSLEELTFHTRAEGGRTRVSMHLKAK